MVQAEYEKATEVCAKIKDIDPRISFLARYMDRD
jgi:hypothetical protein